MKELLEIFEKTFEDKRFSRAEKSAVSRLLEEDYELKKEQRAFLRGKIFDMARAEMSGATGQQVLD